LHMRHVSRVPGRSLAGWNSPTRMVPQPRCIEFASDRTTFGSPPLAALVSSSASFSAASCVFRGGPLIVKTRGRPVWLAPPCGTGISACHTAESLLIALRSMTSALLTSPECSARPAAAAAAEELCGIFALSFTEPDDADLDCFLGGDRFLDGERFPDVERFRETERRPA